MRRDLRLNDQTALYHALNSSYPVLLLFIFDKAILENLSDKKDIRVTFIHQILEKLNKLLVGKRSSLYVLHDHAIAAMETICNEFEVKEVFANHDYEPYSVDRDTAVREFLGDKHIPFHTYKDQVIFERSEILKSDGTPYTVYTPYSRIWKQKYLNQQPETLNSEENLSNLFKTAVFPLPSLNQIGFEKSDPGIHDVTINEEIILHYQDTRNLPSIDGTSRLGVHLRFGTVSVRELARIASRLSEQWLNELIWREFFMMILFHFPHVVNRSFKQKYDRLQWRNNEQEFELWCNGETGYPIVDAGMRQLNATGWMHNRVRMIVASFLCKHLLIDWRWGEAYFAEKLLDYELASNNGNWQWAAGSGCDAAPYFRIFNPTEQMKKFDPRMDYITTWIKDFTPGYMPPIVDHDFARKRALQVYKSSLSAT